jgi:hypothetical protein
VSRRHAVNDEVLAETSLSSQHVEHLSSTRVKWMGNPDYVL